VVVHEHREGRNDWSDEECKTIAGERNRAKLKVMQRNYIKYDYKKNNEQICGGGV
jgi:hypothetical protein